MKIYLGVNSLDKIIVGSKEFDYDGNDLVWKDPSTQGKACQYIMDFPFDVREYILAEANSHNAKKGMLAEIEI